MPSTPPRFPTGYGDPVYKLIMSIPFLSYERRDKLALKWQSIGPTSKVRRVTRWYGRHDRRIIFVLRACIATLPIVLTRIGVGVEWVLSGLVIGLYVTRALARKREELQRSEWIKDAYDAYWEMLQDEQDTNPTV